MNLKIKEVAYHRNGICGAPFHVVRFMWKPDDSQHEEHFLATLFEEKGQCAVISLSRIDRFGVEFGSNSWRGDHFEDELRQAIWPENKNDTI